MKAPISSKRLITTFSSLLVGLYCFVVLSALFQPHHFLQNLEPYPDGLLYSLSARNVVLGKAMQLSYLDSKLEYWVPPLYSIVLVPAFLVSSNPVNFVLLNAMLGVATIVLIALIIWKTTSNVLATSGALLLYVSHSHIFWLPSLPMSENLTVFLVVLGVAGLLLTPKRPLVGVSISLITAISLIFTRYASVTLAVIVGLLTVLQLRKRFSKRGLLVISGVVLLSATTFISLVLSSAEMTAQFTSLLSIGESPYYSLQFLIPNTIGYFKALIGFPSPFLWNMTAFTSIFASMWLVILPILAWKLKRFRYETIVVTSLFLAQFPLMLVFYTLDTRYIIYSLPLIALAGGWSVALIAPIVSRKWLYLAMGLVLLAHVFTQIPHFKQILSANVLGRTVGWQYQAITTFDQYFATTDEPAYLITAIPPFLVDAYSTSTYRVLPLSPAQEFIAKGQWVWGTDTDPELWMSSPPTFRNPRYQFDSIRLVVDDLLVKNEPIFISNAYITHLPQVIKDYETWKEQYVFEAVQTGCEQACDMYRIKMKDLSTTKIE